MKQVAGSQVRSEAGGTSTPRSSSPRHLHGVVRWTVLGGIIAVLAVIGACSHPSDRVDRVSQRALPQATGLESNGGTPRTEGDHVKREVWQPGPKRTTGAPAESQPSWVAAGIAPGPQSGTVVVTPMHVTPGGVVFARSFEAPRRQGERESPQAQALSCRGDVMLVGHGVQVERQHPFDRYSAVQTATLPESVTALLSMGTYAIVGGMGRVYTVDFSRSPSPVASLHEDPSLKKPVDFVLELGTSRIIAVDDVVRPKVGFIFNRFPDDRLHFQFRADLPSGPNERFVRVAADGSNLVLVSRYSVRSGYGNRLHTCTVAHETVTCDTVSEMVVLRSKETTLLTSGDDFTWWQSASLVSGQVIVAAGTRGILAVQGKKASRVGPDGTCLDLMGVGGHLLALVSFGKSHRETDTGLHGGGEHKTANRTFLVFADWDSRTNRLVERWRSPLPEGIVRLQR